MHLLTAQTGATLKANGDVVSKLTLTTLAPLTSRATRAAAAGATNARPVRGHQCALCLGSKVQFAQRLCMNTNILATYANMRISVDAYLFVKKKCSCHSHGPITYSYFIKVI